MYLANTILRDVVSNWEGYTDTVCEDDPADTEHLRPTDTTKGPQDVATTTSTSAGLGTTAQLAGKHSTTPTQLTGEPASTGAHNKTLAQPSVDTMTGAMTFLNRPVSTEAPSNNFNTAFSKHHGPFWQDEEGSPANSLSNITTGECHQR